MVKNDKKEFQDIQWSKIHNISEINYNYNERTDTAPRIPYIPINIPEPFPYPFDQTKNITSEQEHGTDKNDLNNSIPNRQRRELDNGGLDVVDSVHVDYMNPVNFHRSASPKIQEKEKIFPRFHVTYWMFYPYSQVGKLWVYLSKL